jgi:hypothetical protein
MGQHLKQVKMPIFGLFAAPDFSHGVPSFNDIFLAKAIRDRPLSRVTHGPLACRKIR